MSAAAETLVMLAAALSVYPCAALIMAPTSILAEQIYAEAARLLPDFMRVLLVKSGDKPEFDGVNLIIGTHVLLYQNLPAAPLVMIDEQHRFGSNQREKINALASGELGRDPQHDEADGEFEDKFKEGEQSNLTEISPQNRQTKTADETRAHVVQFSATPIPRTLSMIQSSFAEFSFLRQMPFEKHIHTQILQSADFGELLTHIKAQIAKGKQVAMIYPLVESSESSNYQGLEEAQGFWRANFTNVYVTHGKDKEKEQVLREFRECGDVLLSTTVVEVGISLPRLSTIVIVGAERLGLASLHQLRGRVGRNGGSGFCFLFTKLKNPPSRLREFCETLDGFKIAEIDLKNRQSGDILNGAFQHGATFEYYDYEEEITQAAKDRAGLG